MKGLTTAPGSIVTLPQKNYQQKEQNAKSPYFGIRTLEIDSDKIVDLNKILRPSG